MTTLGYLVTLFAALTATHLARVWQGTAYIRQGHQLHRVTGRTAAEIVHDQRVRAGIEREFPPEGKE